MKVPNILTALLLIAGSAHADIGETARHLTGEQQTEHFRIRYRPSSRAGASVDRVAHEIELEYAEILKELGIAGRVVEKPHFGLFLYDSVAEMDSITGLGGSGGFAAGREVHIPWDSDQTRKHELVHIVVAAMKSTGDEPRNMFFAEGIANAVLEYVHGIPVHAVAAYERKRGSLPELKTLVEHPDFYAFLREHPGFNGYDVGGSFFLYLLETYPPKKVMTFYKGKPIAKALGRSLEKIEKGWHARLDSFSIRPSLEILLKRRRGDGGEFTHVLSPEERIPSDVLGKPEEWQGLLGELETTDEVGEWKLEDSSAEAHNSSGGDWSIVEVAERQFGDCVIRAKVETGGQCWGVKVRYGDGCRAMFLGNGVFLYSHDGPVASTGEYQLPGGSSVDLILAIEEGRARVFMNGDLVLEADVTVESSRVGLGMVGGDARFTEFSVREL